MGKERWAKKQVLILIIIALIAFAVGFIPGVVKNHYQNSYQNGNFIEEVGELATGPSGPSGCAEFTGDKKCTCCTGCSAGCKKDCIDYYKSKGMTPDSKHVAVCTNSCRVFRKCSAGDCSGC